MALVALLSGCGSGGGGKIDTSASAPADTAGPTPAPTTAPPTAVATTAATTSITSAHLPSGATVAVIPALSKFDQAPAVLALRAWVDKRLIALRRMDALYGPMARAGSGPLLARTRQQITDYKAKGIKLHGASNYKIVALTRLSPTRVQLNICAKDDSSYFVYPNGRPVQAVVTKNWLPHQYLIEFIGGRWVPTDSAGQKTSCAAAA